jgi:hypothetical protein
VAADTEEEVVKEAADTEVAVTEAAVDTVVAAMEEVEDTAVAVTEAAVEAMEEDVREAVEDMEVADATNSINAAVGFLPSLASQPIRYCFYVLFTLISAILKVPSSSETHF